MKKVYFVFCLSCLFILLSSLKNDEPGECSGDDSRKSTGPPSCYSGEPPLHLTCGATDCHEGSAVNAGSAKLLLDLGGVDSVYVPGQPYTITVSLTRAGMVRGGFQIVALLDNDLSTTPGLITLSDNVRMQMINAQIPHTGGCPTENKTWVEHTANGIDDVVNDTIKWHFNWRAPNTTLGSITFYVAAVDANKDLENTGDFVYTTSKTIINLPTGIEELENDLTLYPNPSNEFIQLPTNAQYETISVTDMMGETVLQGPFNPQFSIAALPSGIYLLHLQGKNKSVTGRFVRE